MAWETANNRSLAAAPLFLSTTAAQLTDVRSQHLLLAEIKRVAADNGPPHLVVLDTLARNFGPGDENDTRDMNLAVLACDEIRRETGSTVLIAHHSSHSDKGRGRGSSALRAAADAEFLLTRTEDGTVVIRATKMKDAPLPSPMSFRFESIDLGLTDDEGEVITSAVLVPTSFVVPTKATTAGTGKNQLRALNILRDLLGRGRAKDAAMEEAQNTTRVAIEDWKVACLESLDRWQFRDARVGLIKASLIAIEGEFVRLREKRENA